MHFDWFFHVLMIYALDKCISDVTIDKFCFFINKTNRFHVAVALLLITEDNIRTCEEHQ